MSEPNLIILASFLGVLALVLGAYWAFVVIPEQRGQGAVRRRLRWESPEEQGVAVHLLKKQQVLSTIETFNVVLKRTEGISGPLTELLEHANVRLTVGTFVLITLTSFLGAMVFVQWFMGVWWLSFIVGGVAGMVPLIVVRQLRAQRILKFEEQFP